MDRSKYKVLIETAQQTFELKAMLNFLGEKIDPKCFDFYDDYMYLIFHTKDGDWMLVNSKHSALDDREDISAKELVKMLFTLSQKPSILSNRCSIQVTNDREFKLLMKHYEAKGWKWASNKKPFDLQPPLPTSISYEDMCCFNADDDEGYKVLPFSVFAAEVGLSVPKFVMKSEDRIDLFEGDTAHHAFQGHGGTWNYNEWFIIHSPTLAGKIFSTEESAEAWIAEQNKPKTITVSPESSYPIEVGVTGALILCGATANHFSNLELTDKEIKEMYNALKSLQSC